MAVYLLSRIAKQQGTAGYPSIHGIYENEMHRITFGEPVITKLYL
jgi:hypothetical protein